MATVVPTNEAAFTLAEVAAATGGELRGDPAARVVGVGSDTRTLSAGTLFVALRGERFDGHAHLAGIGDARIALDLRGAKSWDEVVSRVAAAVKKARPGEWILGRGWHQKEWSSPPEPNVEGFPLHASLSAASPSNPVLLSHASGHAAFVNAAALVRGGVGRDTKPPAGGDILKDASGEPTGLLRGPAARRAARRRTSSVPVSISVHRPSASPARTSPSSTTWRTAPAPAASAAPSRAPAPNSTRWASPPSPRAGPTSCPGVRPSGWRSPGRSPWIRT